MMQRRGPASALGVALPLLPLLPLLLLAARASAEGSPPPAEERNRTELSSLQYDAGAKEGGAQREDDLLRIARMRNSLPFSNLDDVRLSAWDEGQPFNISNLDDFFRAFDPYRFEAVLSERRNISDACNRTLHQYAGALKATDKWAVRMWDATGRHSTGFFWGNSYWTGSKVQCDNIEDAPFQTAFSTLKIVVHLPQHLSTTGTVIHLGVCLPHVCSDSDLKTLTELVMNNSSGKFGDLLGVRSPHNAYLFWKDQVFWILIGTSVFIFSMLILGTAYDFYLEKRQEDFEKNNSFVYNATNSVNKISHQNVRRFPEAIQTLDQLRSNGAVKSFNVNNTISKENKECSFFKSFHLDVSKMLQGILLSFSIRINLKIVCDRDVGSDTIPIIHGLRFLSMIWVVLGHSCIVAFKYSDNMAYRGVMEDNFFFQTITNATFSVDTFFFISGLLVSFLYFRTVQKVDVNSLTKTTGFKSGTLQFFGLLGYRYCRLTVPYMFVLGAVQICMKWFQHNSVFEPPTLDHVNCPKYWWRNALYINTLFPVRDMCMLWSWYLADDTQFYILGSILLILATSHFRFAAAIMTTFLASSWCTTAFIAFSNKHMPSSDDPFALFDKIYDKPWTRLGPYLIGMCVGWYLCKKNCTVQMNKIVVITGWIISTSLLLYLVYGLFKMDLNPVVAAIYSSLSHSLWALGLAWVVIACCTGNGGYVNKLLSMSILYPFSRVTYCAYLVHPIIIRVIPMAADAPMHLTKETVAMLFLGQLVASYIVAFVVSLAFEAPIVSLLKVISPIKKDENKQNATK